MKSPLKEPAKAWCLTSRTNGYLSLWRNGHLCTCKRSTWLFTSKRQNTTASYWRLLEIKYCLFDLRHFDMDRRMAKTWVDTARVDQSSLNHFELGRKFKSKNFTHPFHENFFVNSNWIRHRKTSVDVRILGQAAGVKAWALRCYY